MYGTQSYFYRRGSVIVKDSNCSDWIYVIKSVSAKETFIFFNNIVSDALSWNDLKEMKRWMFNVDIDLPCPPSYRAQFKSWRSCWECLQQLIHVLVANSREGTPNPGVTATGYRTVSLRLPLILIWRTPPTTCRRVSGRARGTRMTSSTARGDWALWREFRARCVG